MERTYDFKRKLFGGMFSQINSMVAHRIAHIVCAGTAITVLDEAYRSKLEFKTWMKEKYR